MVGERWSEAERCHLRKLYAAGASYAQMAQALGRSREAIHHQAQRLGLRGRKKPWTTRELAVIRQPRPLRVLAQELQRSYYSVACARHRTKHLAFVQGDLWDTY